MRQTVNELTECINSTRPVYDSSKYFPGRLVPMPIIITQNKREIEKNKGRAR